jgi:hypothetical protein
LYADLPDEGCPHCSYECVGCVVSIHDCLLCAGAYRSTPLATPKCGCMPQFFDPGLPVCTACSVTCFNCTGNAMNCTTCRNGEYPPNCVALICAP